MKRGMDGGSGVGGKKMKGDNVTLRFLLLSKVSRLAIVIFTITSPLTYWTQLIKAKLFQILVSCLMSEGESISKYIKYQIYVLHFECFIGIIRQSLKGIQQEWYILYSSLLKYGRFMVTLMLEFSLWIVSFHKTFQIKKQQFV